MCLGRDAPGVSFVTDPGCSRYTIGLTRYRSCSVIARSEATWQSVTPKASLCKGRWHGVSRDGGIVLYRHIAIPQSCCRMTAPFTQGGLWCKRLTFCTAVGIPKGEAAETLVVDKLVRFPFGPPEESEEHAEVPRRLFAYFLVGEKVCPRRDGTNILPRFFDSVSLRSE